MYKILAAETAVYKYTIYAVLNWAYRFQRLQFF